MNRKNIYFGIFFVLIVAGIFILPPLIEIALAMLFVMYASISCYIAWLEKDRVHIAVMLIFPVFLSAVQNIYLGSAAPHLSRLELQFLLIMNIMIVFMSFIRISNRLLAKDVSWLWGCLIVILMHTMVMYLIYPSTISALFSSVRNIVSPLIFWGFSRSMKKSADQNKFECYLKWLSIFVVSIGFIEYLIGNEFWKDLNIEQLWTLKGIGVNAWGIPGNWHSSERLNGRHLRRMVSSFADPVNLGTFLFGIYMFAWYRKERVLQLAVIVCCVLTVSKGALLGFLIFFVIYSWYMDRTKISIPLILCLTVSAAYAFLIFSKVSSSGSVAVHLNGFFNSFLLLLRYPFGSGVGNVGVLASLFGGGNILDIDVTETGIGKIIAELGVVGISVYIYFFYRLYRIPHRWNKNERRKKVYYNSLLFSIIANIAFNEVALSPNSCGIYFLILGQVSALERDMVTIRCKHPYISYF